MKRETISVTLTFSIALAPFQIAAIVINTDNDWKKMTCVGSCRKSFQTCTVSTSEPRPPRIAVWK